MGRAGVAITAEMIRTIRRLRRMGLTVKDIAHATGCADATIIRKCRDDPAVEERVNLSRNKRA